MFFQNAVFPLYLLLLPLTYTYFTCPRCSSRQCSYIIFCITKLPSNNLQYLLNTLQDLPQLSSTHSLPYYKFHFHALMMLHVGFFLHLHPIFIYVTFSIFIYTYLSSLQLQTAPVPASNLTHCRLSGSLAGEFPCCTARRAANRYARRPADRTTQCPCCREAMATGVGKS